MYKIPGWKSRLWDCVLAITLAGIMAVSSIAFAKLLSPKKVRPKPEISSKALPVTVSEPGYTGPECTGGELLLPDKRQSVTYLGRFTVTAYCPCRACCGQWSNPAKPLTASGAIAIEGFTVGADPSLIPYGTVLEIDGVGVRTVQDKPAEWVIGKYGGFILDVFFEDHASVDAFGKRECDVWVKNP